MGMSFLFATSHLPAFNRPQNEEEEDNAQPMQRSGGVRAISHLEVPVRRDSSVPLSQRGAQAMGRNVQIVKPTGPRTPPADGVAAAKASGVFDVVRHQYNQGGNEHFMDEHGQLQPRNESRSKSVPSPAAERPSWADESEVHADHEHDPDGDADDGHSPHVPVDTTSWHATESLTAGLVPHDHESDPVADGPAPRVWDLHQTPAPGLLGSWPKKADAEDDIDPDQGSHRAFAAQQQQVRETNPTAQSSRPVAKPQALGLNFIPAIPGPNRDTLTSNSQNGIPNDLDWAKTDPQNSKDSTFPNTTGRSMTEQERSLAEIGENVNLDSLHEWNQAINEGRPVENKPKPNPPLLPRQVSSAEGTPADTSSRTKSPTRKELILGNLPGDVKVKPNPAAKSEAPSHELAVLGTGAVAHYAYDIAYAARIKGIDPDLIKAIMFMEMSHGWYDPSILGVPYSLLPPVKSILPMNVNANYWGDAFGSKAALSSGRINVVSGAEMLRRLQKLAPGVGIAEIATLYNNHNADKVSDYGARVAQIYKDKPWEALTKPASEKGSPKE